MIVKLIFIYPDIVNMTIDAHTPVSETGSSNVLALMNTLTETYTNSMLALDATYPPVNNPGLIILRARRKVFQDWDDFLSYYRRVVHARIDMLKTDELNIDTLPAVLADTESVSSGRFCSSRLIIPKCVLSLCNQLDIFIPHAPLTDLLVLEHQLSSLRQQTHRSLDAATVDLVNLYKNHPEVLRV